MTDALDGFDKPLAVLGQLLQERGLRCALLAIGGGALQLLGLISRPPRYIDVVALVEDRELVAFDALPAPLQPAVEDSAAVLRLPKTWFNAGPRSLMEFGLPERVLEPAHLRAAAAWTRTHDPSEGFRSELRGALRSLGVNDGDE